jgi:hypothetical protein
VAWVAATFVVIFVMLEAMDRVHTWLQWREDKRVTEARAHRQEVPSIVLRRRTPYDWEQE